MQSGFRAVWCIWPGSDEAKKSVRQMKRRIGAAGRLDKFTAFAAFDGAPWTTVNHRGFPWKIVFVFYFLSLLHGAVLGSSW